MLHAAIGRFSTQTATYTGRSAALAQPSATVLDVGRTRNGRAAGCRVAVARSRELRQRVDSGGQRAELLDAASADVGRRRPSHSRTDLLLVDLLVAGPSAMIVATLAIAIASTRRSATR